MKTYVALAEIWRATVATEAGRSARAVAVEATMAAVLGGGDWCRHAVWAALQGRGGIE